MQQRDALLETTTEQGKWWSSQAKYTKFILLHHNRNDVILHLVVVILQRRYTTSSCVYVVNATFLPSSFRCNIARQHTTYSYFWCIIHNDVTWYLNIAPLYFGCNISIWHLLTYVLQLCHIFNHNQIKTVRPCTCACAFDNKMKPCNMMMIIITGWHTHVHACLWIQSQRDDLMSATMSPMCCGDGIAKDTFDIPKCSSEAEGNC